MVGGLDRHLAGLRHGHGHLLDDPRLGAAVNGLTLCLARALAPKVRVNAVLPGLIEGRWMRDGLGDEVSQRVTGGLDLQGLLVSPR
jgi:hypothetical protein